MRKSGVQLESHTPLLRVRSRDYFVNIEHLAAVEDIADAVEKMVARIQEFVPGYTLTLKPLVDKGIITTTVTVRGAGDFLPEYAGNLDIETAAAVKVAEQFAEVMLGGLEDELE